MRGHLPEDLLVRTKGAPLRICSSQTRCVTRSEPAAVTDPPTDSRRKILQHRLQCLLCTNLEHVRGAPPDTVVLVDDSEALDLAGAALEYRPSAVGDHQLERLSSCREWSIYDLVNHVNGGGHHHLLIMRGAPAESC